MPAALTTLQRIPLAQVGTWNTQVGDGTMDHALLDAIVTASADPLVRTPRVLLGHSVRQGDSGVEQVPRPAIGHVDNLTVDGDTLYGDLHVPDWLAAVAETAIPARSIEAWRNYQTANGDQYPAVLTGVALLSDELPAVDTLQDLRDLWDRHPAPQPAEPIAAGAAATPLVVCALAPASPIPSAAPAADNPDQEATVPTDPAPAEMPVVEPEAAVQPDTPTEPDAPTAPGEEPAAAAPEVPDGFVLMDAAKVAEFEAGMAKLNELLAAKADEDANTFADSLVAAGKIAPASRDRIVSQYKQAPDATKAFADLLPEQTVPTGSLTAAARQPATEPDDDTDTGVSDRLLNPAQRARLVELGLIKD